MRTDIENVTENSDFDELESARMEYFIKYQDNLGVCRNEGSGLAYLDEKRQFLSVDSPVKLSVVNEPIIITARNDHSSQPSNRGLILVEEPNILSASNDNSHVSND